MTTDAFPSHSPKVLLWFKLYSGFLCLIYLLVAVGSIFLFQADPQEMDMAPAEARIMGGVFLVIGLGLFAVCLLPLVLAPRPWLWTYNLVVICLGMTSACFLPICIPLLISWLKPETKSYFGKS